MHQPLSGLRVLTIEQDGAGPYGTQLLASLGADVIKIENPSTGGDSGRCAGPYFLGEYDSEFFQTFNRGKRSMALDLKDRGDRRIFERLLATADACANNLRGDLPAELQVDYAHLRKIKPDIVCAHLSAYGRDSERAHWPGYDYLMQAEAGLMAMTGEPDAPPTRFGMSMIDYMGGAMMALGLVSAVLGAKRTGRGCDVDVSLYDVALNQLSYPATWYLNEGKCAERQERSAHPSVAPSQLFRTADGWIFVMCQAPKFWGAFCKAIGREDLLANPAYADMAARRMNREKLQNELDAFLSTRTTAAWMARLGGVAPAAPVNSMSCALGAPEARSRIETVSHPDKPEGLKLVRDPVRINGQNAPSCRAPKLGEDTRDILDEMLSDKPGDRAAE
ncbi:MAG: CoA transferase [Oceanicaulis sp.]|uniref:CaiB/BaiF CoA transferase family protein n=1 Tax=unclassified Oceanicaulis TaxID=2632123 RepID=UPI000C45D346|nr:MULTISPECIES: CoA transferase [unclassified Oceanicaulis]MAB68195.1 CoA transferase [Oceanicaulis sp.]MBC37901.1 CoA transferase [Oceanicaulis sp.]MBG34659.1 CoA transferase [Oceanicaulis sp.]HBU60887.1 CoA transferase [Oceanicaulis sp.]|tara:strand:+ start:228 stop:1400 length:1173 start_codon:yes stop_codon:yes gene_type:complete